MINLSPYLPTLRKNAAHFNLSKEDREDLIQDTLLNFWRKYQANKVDLTQNVEGYLLKLLRWRVLDKYDKENREKNNRTLPNPDNDLDLLVGGETGYTNDDREILAAAINSVKNNSRTNKTNWQIFDFYLKNGSIRETAQKFCVEESRIYIINWRIRQKIVSCAKTMLN